MANQTVVEQRSTSAPEMVQDMLAAQLQAFKDGGPRAVYQNRWRVKDQLRKEEPSRIMDMSKELRTIASRDGGGGGVESLRCVVNSIVVENVHHADILADARGEARNGVQDEMNQLLFEIYGDTLNYPNKTPEEAAAKRREWCRLSGSGSPTAVHVEKDATTGKVTKLSYGDHVTRMLAEQQKQEEVKHTFTVPDLGDPKKFVRIRLSEEAKEEDREYTKAISQLNDENLRVFKQTLDRFAFERWEDTKQGFRPIPLEAPVNFAGRAFNQDASGNFMTDSNVLHIPVKLPSDMVDMLNAEGRRLPDGAEFDAEEVYLPEAIAKSSDVVALVKQALRLEHKLDRERLRKNYLLLSVRAAVLEGGMSLGQGGWHSDGAQGCERIQMDGLKTPIDRAYTISSAMPTMVSDLRLNLDAHRTYAEKLGLTLDQFNMQDIIQKTIDQAESDARKLGKTIVKYAVPNVVEYLNPTMLHSAQTFIGPPGDRLMRSFMRILFTEIPRDRLGDTINPVIGPIYSIKIKLLTDIFEPPWDVTQFAYTHPDVPYTMGTPTALRRQRGLKPTHSGEGLEDSYEGSEDDNAAGNADDVPLGEDASSAGPGSPRRTSEHFKRLMSAFQPCSSSMLAP